MEIRLDPKPLVPLYPIQQERQPDYPRALGPVFIGNPYRAIPEAKPRQEPAYLVNLGQPASRTSNLPSGLTEARPGTSRSAVQPGTLGAGLDITA